MRKVGGVNYEKLDMDKLRSLAPGDRGMFVQYTDSQLIAAAHALGDFLKREGLYKDKGSATTAMVAAAAPVAVAAATGGLAGGGRRAQNRLLMAILLGLGLWLLLKPKKSGCGCPTDRDRRA